MPTTHKVLLIGKNQGENTVTLIVRCMERSQPKIFRIGSLRDARHHFSNVKGPFK